MTTWRRNKAGSTLSKTCSELSAAAAPRRRAAIADRAHRVPPAPTASLLLAFVLLAAEESLAQFARRVPQRVRRHVLRLRLLVPTLRLRYLLNVPRRLLTALRVRSHVTAATTRKPRRVGHGRESQMPLMLTHTQHTQRTPPTPRTRTSQRNAWWRRRGGVCVWGGDTWHFVQHFWDSS